jgi:hypothetical protein
MRGGALVAEIDVEYLRRIEQHARVVVDEASAEGWLTCIEGDDQDQSRLQRAVNELARHIRYVHYEGDGCLDHIEADT